MKTVLITTYYQSKNKLRSFEMAQCLAENCHNKLIDAVIVLVDEYIKVPPIKSKKLKFINVLGRPTYQTLFNIANRCAAQYKIICNGDIYFKEQDVMNIQANLKKHEVYALSRWDVHPSGVRHWNHWDSQDAWIFNGEIRKGSYEYELGVAACDNKITYALECSGYKVLNPSKSIRSFHLHITGARTYTDDKGVALFRLPPPYTLVTPTYIGEQFSYKAAAPTEKDLQDIKTDGDGKVEYSYQAQADAMKKLLRERSFETNYLLTIAIPTLKSRKHLYDKLVAELNRQIKEGGFESDVQIYSKRDNGFDPIGWKRNHINIHCAGKYVAHFDDDDIPSPDYISSIVRALKENKGIDCVTFKAIVTYDGENPEEITYHVNHKNDKQRVDKYGNRFREKMVSHLCAIKREHVLKHPFKVIVKEGATNRRERHDNGTDVEFSREMVENETLKTSHHIDKVLYYYKYIQNK